MNKNNPPIVAELLAENNNCTRAVAEPLKNFARANPDQINDVLTAYRAALARFNDGNGKGGEVRQVGDALAELIIHFPDATTQLRDAIERMTAHQEAPFRAEAYRCLGSIGAVQPSDTERVIQIVADGVTDQDDTVRTAALWSLAKLGLIKPDALTPFREQIYQQFRTDSCHTGRENKYAAEALTANAHGSIDITEYTPPGSFRSGENTKAAAAWAIQRAAQNTDIKKEASGQRVDVTNVTESHLSITSLSDQLIEWSSNAESRLAIASVAALGYLTADQPEFSQTSKYLEALLDLQTSQDEGSSPTAEELITVRKSQQGPPNEKEILKSLITAFEAKYGDGAPIEVVIREARRYKLTSDEVYASIDHLKRTGEIYEAQNGYLGTAELIQTEQVPPGDVDTYIEHFFEKIDDARNLENKEE